MAAKKPIHLDTLKISSISTEGPTKTATGGVAGDTLLKYGKKFTIEMQDAMGRYETLDQLYGTRASDNGQILAITDRFPGEKTLIGTTFVVDQKTGAKQPLRICIPIFNCDGIFNLTQDAEGDVTTFDLNGQIARFESDSEGTVNAEGQYERGTDNLFYFFATEKGMEHVMKNGYRATWNADKTSEDFKVGSGDTAGTPSLDAMLKKFGVVTVMDVDIYDAVRFEASDTDYRIGEWDAVTTFAPYLETEE